MYEYETASQYGKLDQRIRMRLYIMYIYITIQEPTYMYICMRVCMYHSMGAYDSTVQNLMEWSPATASRGNLQCQEREEATERSEEMGTWEGVWEGVREGGREGGRESKREGVG